MAAEDLTRVLDEAGVGYDLLPHVHTISAAAEAEALGLAPRDVAKTADREDGGRLRTSGAAGVGAA